MLKWFSGEEGESGPAGPGSPRSAAGGAEVPLEELAERLNQTELLVSQLKEMVREKDAALRSKDDQLKVEKEACEAKLSKLRLQNKAKVTSLTSQLEELKKRHGDGGTPTHGKKGSSDGGGEQASRGKIVLLKKKVEELEQQLALRDEELENKRKECALQRQRGEEMDAMLTERDRRLAEKEAYIVHLQTGLAGSHPVSAAPQQKVLEVGGGGGEVQELQLLVQSLTRKVEESEERYSLLLEQADGLKALLASERETYGQKESMFKQNIQTFKDILIQKDNQLTEINQMHEQELFRLAAKSDASADLEQLLKALKQKLHEKEEVLNGKTQVIDVLQGEVDGRDQQIKELSERLHRLQVERESLESKMEAEKHVMRAQLRDLMEKHRVEVERLGEQHQEQVDRVQQDLLGQLEELRRAAAPPVSEEAPGNGTPPADLASVQKMAELEAQAKQKNEEASRSEAKFLKIKAWSKSRIRQLEEELKKSQAGAAPPDLMALRSRITALEEEREENQWKLENYEELKAKSEMLEAKLVLYEEQQRTLQAELEQFTKRAASQASESGSADDAQSQVLEWQEMAAEAVSARDRAREEKVAMALRISHMEEEREALATRQQELEEELAQARGPGRPGAKKLAAPAHRSLQEDFEFDGQSPFQDPRSTSESTTPMEGENMGGWWPEYSSPDTGGLRSVVEELELERNQLQEQILSLEERCQDLEDRLQLQARIEALQNETEKLQSQLAAVRSQQSREAEKHQLLVNSLNEQLKGLTDSQESLESSLLEKENTLAQTSEKLELIGGLRETLSQKEAQVKELSDRLLQAEHSLENVNRRCSSSEKQCSELKTEAADLMQKLSALKEKAQKQEVTIETLQTELDQTSEELDKLNSAHLEDRAQLIHDLQSCEREIDGLKEALLEKEREISSLAGNMAEYAEQVDILKQEAKLKEESLVQLEDALRRAEQEAAVIRDSQNSDQQTLNGKITELLGKLREAEAELEKSDAERRSKAAEAEHLLEQARGDKKAIQELRAEVQRQNVSQRSHLSECESQISSLKEQLTLSAKKLQDRNTINEKLQQELKEKEEAHERELKSSKEEQNKLLAQAEKYGHQVLTLSSQLEEQTQQKLEAIRSLDDRIRTADQKAEDEKGRLNEQLRNKTEGISKLQEVIKSAETEKQELEVKLRGLNEELELQKCQAHDLHERVASVLQLNRGLEEQVRFLTEQRDELQLDVTERIRAVSEVTAERDSLQSRISSMEAQLSESNATIQGLQREKEDLKQVIEQSSHSNSEILLAKTSECSRLLEEAAQSKREAEEQERTAAELQARVQTQQNLQTHLEETLSVLREEESNLKSELIKKDAALKQREEQESRLREELSQLMQQLKEREETCRSQKDQLNDRNKAVKLLESDAEARKTALDALNSHLQELTEENASLRNSCESKEKELSLQKQAVSEIQAQVINLTDDNRRLQEELGKNIKSVFDLTAERDSLQEKASSLKNQISDNQKAVSVLREEKEELRKILMENERSASAGLLEKTRECAHLEERLRSLQEEVEQLKEKERSQLEAQQNQLLQLQDTVSMLQEQGSALKAALMEKDTTLKQREEEQSRLGEELSLLMQQLQEREETCRSQKEQLNDRNEAVKSLESDVKAKKTELDALNSCLQALTEENRNLNNSCESKENELSLQKQAVSELGEQLKASVELNSKIQAQVINLTDDNQRLQKELGKNIQSFSGLTTERDLLQEKASRLENQISGNQKAISVLREEKEELRKILTENERSVSAGLLEKTKECAHLEERLQSLQEEVKQLKEQERYQLEAQQNQLLQLQDTVSMLQEQGSALKAALMEKDTTLNQKAEECGAYQNELLVQKELVSKLTEEAESLRKEMSHEVQRLQDELEKRNETVLSLSSQLGAMNQNAAEMETEICSLKDSLQRVSAESMAELTDLKDSLQALSDQNTRLKSELQNMAGELLGSQELICSLKTELADLRDVRSAAEAMNLAAQEKDEKLGKLEAFIQQLHSQIAKQDEHNVTLQNQLQQTTSVLRGQVDQLTSEACTLKNALEEKERHQSHSSSAVENLSSRLRGKEAECESLKEQISHPEESVSKLRSSLQVQASEAERLRGALAEKESAFLEQSKSVEEVQRSADEASLFKSQLVESTEMASQLQSQIQLLSAESENLRRSAEETQDTLANLEEKHAANLEELQDVRRRLSERTEEVGNLRGQLDETNKENQVTKNVVEKLRSELCLIRDTLDMSEASNSRLTREKDDALASHEASMAQLTVEIERLKSQHLQVAEQMNALTENLEQREMALHAINNQYGAQAKQAVQLLSEMQQLEERNKSLSEERRQLQGEAARLRAEKEDLERIHCRELQEKTSETQSLQAEVSAKDEELSRLKENVQKIEQILQDSEKEWLSLLDREKQDKSRLVEQLESLTAEMRSKDVKVDALKEDLNGLQVRLAEASAAVVQGSDQLSAKESEASASRVQLEGVLASIQEREDENRRLHLSLLAVEEELRRLVTRSDTESNKSAASNQEKSSLQDLIQQVQDCHRAEISALKRNMAETADQRKETVEKYSHLQSELRVRDEQVSCMNLQISQQKELLSSLSQQLKDKDASIAQVIESASNERLKLVEENETMERAQREISLQLQEQLLHLQRENSEKLHLMKEAERLQKELAAVSKEKEAIKKKLQAALVVRKDLLRKIDEYEKQKEGENNKLSVLQEKLNEMKQTYEEKISVLEEKILEHKAAGEGIADQLKTERQILQSELMEKEASLCEALEKFTEKNSVIEELKSRTESVEQDRSNLMQKVEELQNEIKTCRDELKDRSSASATDLESELTRMKLEKATLQKKAQAALLARKETLKKAQENEKKLTEEHKVLMEQHRLQGDELEQLQKVSVARLDEVNSLRQLVEEKDKSLASLQTELDTVVSRLESISLEMADKDKVLERTQAEVEQKTQEMEQHKTGQQENQELRDRNLTLETQLKEEKHENEEKIQILLKEKEAVLEQNSKLRANLDEVVGLVSQKSSEYLAIHKKLTETEQERDCFAKEAEKARVNLTELERQVDLLKQEKNKLDRFISELTDEITSLKNESQDCNKKHVNSCDCAERFEVKLKEKEAQVSEKDQLITSLELQLLQQAKMHEVTVDKRRTEVDGLQRSQEDNQTQLLTRKLQAALVSRKDLMKENALLKEEVEKLSSQQDVKEAEYSDLQTSVLRLKQQNVELEGSASSVVKERDVLAAEVDRILNDNRSLSAACDSLKLTIESITQQKQAFSCQLESLKDSQTEELSKWKSKHGELKHEYESLLQAYENVSSEMDKMRQVLEGAKRERQEALRRIHEQETQKEVLENQARKVEEESERIKERMHKFTREKRQKIENLEEENWSLRKRLSEFDGNHEMVASELRDKNKQMEAKITQLKDKFADIQAENIQLAENLNEAHSSLEEKRLQLNSSGKSMQLKLDEALCLNNSLTAQIEAQKTELGAQLETSNLLRKEKAELSERLKAVQNELELELEKRDLGIQELRDVISKHSQETISLNEKVRILEDDKSLLQEELENTQEISDKVKNENEYLETVILKNSERIDELTESVSTLQTQNAQLAANLAECRETGDKIRREKEQEQLRLVRELEEKLKTVQRGSEGSKNVKRELQELLKEKHQEINQLQQNCIRYQEVILDLENSLKSSQATCEHLEKEMKKNSEKTLASEERSKRLESESVEVRKLLQKAEEKITSAEYEKEQLTLQISHNVKQLNETQSSQNVEETQRQSFIQNQLQQQLDELKNLKEKESVRVDELIQQLDAKDLQINALRRTTETAEAKLSALTSTPHGADTSRLWDDLYQRSLHQKDKQLLEQGSAITRFLEDIRSKERELNELQVAKLRLERTLNDYSVAAAAHQRQMFIVSATNAELSENSELMTVQVKELCGRVERLEREKNVLNQQLAEREDELSQLQPRLQQTEKLNVDAEAQLCLLQMERDKVQADFEKQLGISLQLKTLLQGKDAEISSLLSCKDGQMSGYLEQLQANYRSQVSVYEDRLTSSRYQREKLDKETRALQAKVKSLEIQMNRSIQEKEQMEVKIESFKNSMVSLQSERERLMSEYRVLEAKTQLGLKDKEGSPDGEGNSSKGFKHEIRKLLHQMDDLNSENAMLRAQLVRYREDLNQVLSLKDNQVKVLLQKQQDVIRNLEIQKVAVEKMLRDSQLEVQEKQEESNAIRVENAELKGRVSKLEAERGATNEGKVIADLQHAVVAKASECSDLQHKLLSQKASFDELKSKMQQLEAETDKKLAEAEDKYNGELDSFEREVELMRNERETADQRVAELAKELLDLEQQLVEAQSQSKDLKVQKKSLCKAMAALQNDRDQLIEDFKTLRNRYDEELRQSQVSLNKVECSLQDASSDLAAFAKERDILILKLKAIESKDAHTELSKLLDELSKALSAKERELKRVVLENSTFSRQLSAFSRSMASLQNDRDRLVDELAGAKRVAESGQWSSPETVPTLNPENENTACAFQDGNDGLVKRRKADELHQSAHSEVDSYQENPTDLRSEAERKEPLPIKETAALAGQSSREEAVSRLEAEKMQLYGELQRCVYEIQQRDQYFQQLNTKLQQAVEEKAAAAGQLRTVAQTLRNTQNRCHWLETQIQIQAQQGSSFAEVAPGAPQERSSDSVVGEAAEAALLRERLLEAEQSLADERARRETAEEALRLAEEAAKSAGAGPSRDAQRDFSIDMEPDEEWDALSLNPNQPLITRKVKGGMVACRRWLRGRSLYFSRLLTSRARSRYFFLAYLLTLHLLVLMCLSGAW